MCATLLPEETSRTWVSTGLTPKTGCEIEKARMIMGTKRFITVLSHGEEPQLGRRVVSQPLQEQLQVSRD